MKSTKSKFYAISLLAVVSIVGMIISACSSQPQNPNKEIANFEQCAAAGNPVMESYPRQCRANGETFAEQVVAASRCGNGICEDGEADDPGGCGPGADPRCLGPPAREGTRPQDCKTSGKMPASFTKEIDTGKGTLFLTYGTGKTLLSGSLERSTPCVSWKVLAISTKDMPTSQVSIKISDENKDSGMMCIQVVAEPQEISEELFSTSENTNYNIEFEEKSVFAGKLGN